MGVRTRNEVHLCAFGKLHLELLDKRSHVLVGDNGTFVFLDAHDRIRHGNGAVALYLALASQAPVFLHLLTSELSALRVENFTATFIHLAFALSATTLTATCRREIDVVSGQGAQQTATLLYANRVFTIDGDIDVARG